MGMPEMGR
jgi:hypothetical protein